MVCPESTVQCVDFKNGNLNKKFTDPNKMPENLTPDMQKAWYLWSDAQKGLGTNYSDTPVKTPSHDCVCPKEGKEGGK